MEFKNIRDLDELLKIAIDDTGNLIEFGIEEPEQSRQRELRQEAEDEQYRQIARAFGFSDTQISTIESPDKGSYGYLPYQIVHVIEQFKSNGINSTADDRFDYNKFIRELDDYQESTFMSADIDEDEND